MRSDLHCAQIENALREAGTEGSQICQFCSIPRLILDPSGRARIINRAFITNWDIDPDRFINNPGYNVFRDPFLKDMGLKELFENATEGESVDLKLSEYSFPHVFTSGHGTPHSPQNLSVSILPIFNDGKLVAISAAYECEVSVYDKLEEGIQLQEIAVCINSIGEFCHELNNPLLLISGNAQLILAKHDKIPPDFVKKVQKVLSGAEKMQIIIERFKQNTIEPCRNTGVIIKD